MTFVELEQLLDSAIQHNLNVLLEGTHGVGKTSMVLNAFEKRHLNFKYFSCSTLDPIMHFCGIPSIVEKDGKKHLDFVMPSYFALDQVEAIFLDELNRARDETTNSVMELILFKSINGVKLKNLKYIWAAINPANSGYNVSVLDPAVEGRFQYQIKVPNRLNIPYLKSKHSPEIVDYLAFTWQSFGVEAKEFFDPRRWEWIINAVENQIPLEAMCGKFYNIVNEKVYSFICNFITAPSDNERKIMMEKDVDSTIALMNFANDTTNKNSDLAKLISDLCPIPEINNVNINTEMVESETIIYREYQSCFGGRFDFDKMKQIISSVAFTKATERLRNNCNTFTRQQVIKYSKNVQPAILRLALV